MYSSHYVNCIAVHYVNYIAVHYIYYKTNHTNRYNTAWSHNLYKQHNFMLSIQDCSQWLGWQFTCNRGAPFAGVISMLVEYFADSTVTLVHYCPRRVGSQSVRAPSCHSALLWICSGMKTKVPKFNFKH